MGKNVNKILSKNKSKAGVYANDEKDENNIKEKTIKIGDLKNKWGLNIKDEIKNELEVTWGKYY